MSKTPNSNIYFDSLKDNDSFHIFKLEHGHHDENINHNQHMLNKIKELQHENYKLKKDISDNNLNVAMIRKDFINNEDKLVKEW